MIRVDSCYSASRSQYGIYSNETEIDAPTVLYMDSSGYWAPLPYLYMSWGTGGRCLLVSRHPENVLEDIVGRYCPQCATRYTGDDAMTYQNRCSSCFQCPVCTSPLSVIARSSTECIFQCGYCCWRSDGDSAGATFVALDKRELETLVLTHEREIDSVASDAFSTILKKYTTPAHALERGESDASPSKGHLQRWGLADLTKKMSLAGDVRSRLNESDISVAVPPGGPLAAAHSLVPQRVQLRSKRTVRSRLDVHHGRMKILVQPKPNPLDGDSSQKNRGSWWVKDSSAIHELPR
jgi:hypothetical protein